MARILGNDTVIITQAAKSVPAHYSEDPLLGLGLGIRVRVRMFGIADRNREIYCELAFYSEHQQTANIGSVCQ